MWGLPQDIKSYLSFNDLQHLSHSLGDANNKPADNWSDTEIVSLWHKWWPWHRLKLMRCCAGGAAHGLEEQTAWFCPMFWQQAREQSVKTTVLSTNGENYLSLKYFLSPQSHQPFPWQRLSPLTHMSLHPLSSFVRWLLILTLICYLIYFRLVLVKKKGRGPSPLSGTKGVSDTKH